MEIRSEILDEIEGYHAQILELSPSIRETLADLDRADAIRSQYESLGFAVVEQVLPPAAWEGLVLRVLPILSVVSDEVDMRHEELSPVRLSDAARFRRVDPHCLHNPDTRELMTSLLRRLGLLEFGSVLASKLAPLIQRIAGRWTWRRTYFYLYEEGDYISVHNDHQVGDRVDVQFPISFGTPGGIRVLSQGYLQIFYDAPGSMNILGSRVWHDVPPIVRVHSDVTPRRFNMGFRFTPD